MGFVDSVLKGRGPDYKRPLLDLVDVAGVWTAARTGGLGLSITGGQVVLARNYLVFSPWDMEETRAFLAKWLGKAGVPHVDKVDKLLSATKLLDPVVLSVADVERVEVLNRASLFKPPRARLHFRDARHFDLGILHSPTTMSLSRKNNLALNDFLSKLGVPTG